MSRSINIDKIVKEVSERQHSDEIREYKKEYEDILLSKDYLAEEYEVQGLAEVLAEIKLAYTEKTKIELKPWQIEMLKNFIDASLNEY